MSPFSRRARFWVRVLRVVVVLWILFVGLLLIQSSPASYENGAGLAAVSGGISQVIVEGGLILLVAVIVTWVWERLAARRS